MISLHESMEPGQDQTHDPWISKLTRYSEKLFVSFSLDIDKQHFENRKRKCLKFYNILCNLVLVAIKAHTMFLQNLSINPFTALPRALLVMKTASYTPLVPAPLVVNTPLFICTLLAR